MEAAGASGPQKESEEVHDVVYAFFQNCFFLKDWMIDDASLEKSVLNQFVNDHVEMGICRDICNGTKHFAVNAPSVHADFFIGREYAGGSRCVPIRGETWFIIEGG